MAVRPATVLGILLSLIASAAARSPAEEECVEYLLRHMPETDRQLVDREFLARNAHFAMAARERTAWASGVPWSLFLDDVLPYAVLNERRDDWRGFFFEALSPLVAGAASLEQAASAINARIWSLWNLQFVGGQTPQTMSPFEVLSAGNASCTGFSILLADALRSVGVPARIAGTPEWNDGSGGNHDWVEVWFNGRWNFIDAFDGTKFNEGWFVPSPLKYQRPNSGNHSIYVTSFKSTPESVHFPMAWDFQDVSVPGMDATEWYLGFIDQEQEDQNQKLTLPAKEGIQKLAFDG